MVSFEIFVKAMPPSLSELKVLPSFCFAFKIPDDVTVTNIQSVSTQNAYSAQMNVAIYTIIKPSNLTQIFENEST